ncbi:MAG: M48 family metalloprotease [Bryobacteraceae bacterium]
MRIAILILLAAAAGSAQFGGLINKAKEKMQKAKPVTDRAERAAATFRPWSAEEEQEIGAATAAKMIAIFGLVEVPKVTRYVNLVGGAVAQFAPRQMPYRFGVLDTDIVGAFAIPGGYIFITRAALTGMTSEAQLAGALGHEIVHASERHLETEIRQKKTSTWAVEEARTQARTGQEYLRQRADAFVKDMMTTKMSRDKEDAADTQGSRIASQAGYAPGGLLEFLRAMARASAQAGKQRMFGQLLSTHPPFEERIGALEPVVGTGSGQTLENRFRAAIFE